MRAWALSTEDGRRQVAVANNLMQYQRFEEDGKPKPDPVTDALVSYMDKALGGTPGKARKGAPKAPFAHSLASPAQIDALAATAR
ncbi:hypothetical protein [Streptomyces tritici]|uniref:hypothetical protein n=1 Tax=Streptomyces tritici TaxID=2054410 RepID=UPI003AF18480